MILVSSCRRRCRAPGLFVGFVGPQHAFRDCGVGVPLIACVDLSARAATVAGSLRRSSSLRQVCALLRGLRFPLGGASQVWSSATAGHASSCPLSCPTSKTTCMLLDCVSNSQGAKLFQAQPCPRAVALSRAPSAS